MTLLLHNSTSLFVFASATTLQLIFFYFFSPPSSFSKLFSNSANTVACPFVTSFVYPTLNILSTILDIGRFPSSICLITEIGISVSSVLEASRKRVKCLTNDSILLIRPSFSPVLRDLSHSVTLSKAFSMAWLSEESGGGCCAILY